MINMVTRSLIVAAMAGGVALAVALPAAAAGSPTTITFTLVGGSLSVGGQTNAVLTNTASGTTSISGNLGANTVTDARGGTAGWTVSAISSAFTGPGTATTSSSSGSAYTAGTASSTGTVTTAVPGSSVAMSSTTPATVISGSGVSGNNTATWNPVIVLTMPASALAGSYAGTVTTSVA